MPHSTSTTSTTNSFDEVEDWQDFYNWHRIHSAINSPPGLKDVIPDEEEVAAKYNRRTEDWHFNLLLPARLRERPRAELKR